MSPTEKGIFLSLLPQVRQAGRRPTDCRPEEQIISVGGEVGEEWWGGGTDSDVTRK